MSFVHVKGGFLRLDWLAAAVIAMCLIKKERYKTAGAVFAYAAASRIFPVIFLLGLGAIGLWHVASKRQIHRQLAGFFIVFAIVSAALMGGSAAVFGTDYWGEFADKIVVHNNDISTTRVGFKYFFVRSADDALEKATFFDEHQPAWLAIQAAVILLTIIGAARLKPYEAMGLSFVPVYFLTAPTFYYYMMLSIPLMMFLPDFNTFRRALGLSLFFVFSVAGYVLHRFHGLNFDLSFYLSSLLLCICGYMIAWSMPPVPVPQATGKLRRAWSVPMGIATGVVVGIASATFIYFSTNGNRAVPTAANTDPAVADAPAPEPAESVIPPVQRSVAPTPEGAARIVFGGDVMLARNVERSIRGNNRDWVYPFAAIAPFVHDSEIAFCNLESPISGRGTAIEKRYLFNAPPEAVQGLAHARFDVVSLANNHILDYGLEAMDDTVRNLTQAGIRPLGLTAKNEPQTPVVLERNGVRVGFLGYVDPESPFADAKEFAGFDRGPAKASFENVKRDIDALRPNCDIIVVSVHWGIEYEPAPDERQRAIGRYAIDQGAGIVAGHHPHVQQPIERYGPGVILYSLGNLVFDQWSRKPTREAKLVRITVTREGGVLAVEELPAAIVRNEWQTRPETEAYIPWTGETAPVAVQEGI
jgi:poly-gamma-glutamate synthesis protein (capsule biosynthesis protein)